ncbi:SMI1/KNR4 family protein [Kitasatospora sp. NPDC127059]|uniref:SMI1/KNR4 family protein n=1 Tax=unclassified Kitasatospora TaxID=2633591 RepID=UPI0036581353
MHENQSEHHEVVAALQELLSHLGPTRGETVEWGAAERIYGVAFPADYRAFVAAFGGGSIDEAVGIDVPAVTPDEQRPAGVSRHGRVPAQAPA